jgi:hypothetical protein
MNVYRTQNAYEPWHVEPGGVIRPWIAAGPSFFDVSDEIAGRGLFEDLESRSGETLFRQYVSEGEPLLTHQPIEGDSLEYKGETRTYTLIENEEPFVNWGTYFTGNHVVAMFLCTHVHVPSATTVTLALDTRIDPQIAVAVNGRLQYRSYEDDIVRTNRSWEGEFSTQFRLRLEAGANVITCAAFRLGRIACGALRLRMLDESLLVTAPLREEPDGLDRKTVESARNLYHPAREWFYPNDRVRLLRQVLEEGGDVEVECEIVVDGETLHSITISADTSEVDLGPADNITAAEFELRTTPIVNGRRLAPRVYGCSLVRRTPSIGESGSLTADFADRCQIALRHFAVLDDSDARLARDATSKPNPIDLVCESWAQVARYALGHADLIDPLVISEGCKYVDRRLDCADFIVHPFLWLLYLDREKREIDPELADLMTATCLGFRYWTDEPGKDSLVTGTENHQILFHSAEIVAGHLWPDDIFTNNGMTGQEHIEHGRALALTWLENRMRTGFQEWHSSSYYPHWIAALIALAHLIPGEETALKRMADAVLTFGFLNIASDSFGGALVTSHGRVYAPMLKVPDNDGCSGLHWLLFGDGNLTEGTAVVPIAAGGVRVSGILDSIARDTGRVSLTRHHSGDARFTVYRTPDFLLSVLQDYRPGERAAQVHPFQLTFRDSVALFFSCPQTSNEGGGFRPDYWSGNGSLPRVFGEKNVAVLLFNTGEAGWMSHCYFERDRYDHVEERHGWLFARKTDGYVAIWSENGYETATCGRYAGRELICRAESNVWIVEAGRKEVWGEFSHFVAAFADREPAVHAGAVEYSSPSVGEIDMGWHGPILLNGRAMSFDYPLVDSPYGYSEYDSGKMTIRHGDAKAELP